MRRKHKPESIEKMRKARLGTKHSPETIKKMSLAKKNYIPWNKGKKMPEGFSQNCSKIFKGRKAWNKGLKLPYISGENHYLWKEDRTQIKKYWTERNNPEYKRWRNKVKERDGHKCKMENKECKGKLVAHHILRWSEYPELRYDINNGITLCHYHHPRKKEEEINLSPYFQTIINTLN